MAFDFSRPIHVSEMGRFEWNRLSHNFWSEVAGNRAYSRITVRERCFTLSWVHRTPFVKSKFCSPNIFFRLKKKISEKYSFWARSKRRIFFKGGKKVTRFSALPRLAHALACFDGVVCMTHRPKWLAIWNLWHCKILKWVTLRWMCEDRNLKK